jgi:hypothetical protein
MNRHPRDMTTNAAEGLPRRRFTVAELEAITAAGILDDDERTSVTTLSKDERLVPLVEPALAVAVGALDLR